MQAEIAGLAATEALIEVAQRLVAALQDAGVTHVRDVSVSFVPADQSGREVEVGTSAGPVERLMLDCADLTIAQMPERLAVLRPTPGVAPKRSFRPRRSQS